MRQCQQQSRNGPVTHSILWLPKILISLNKDPYKVKIFYAYESLFNISFVNLNLPLNRPVLENDKN